MTLARSKITPDANRRNPFRKFLAKQLHKTEVEVILSVFKAEQRGEHYYAGKLGIAESLCKRGWLCRNSDGTVSLSEQTRTLLAEIGGNW